MSLIAKIVGFCCRFAGIVVATEIILALAAGVYTATHFRMDTDSEKLISSSLPWRQRELRFDALFPQQNNLILVVIDGATPERTEEAAAALAAKLDQRHDIFPIVRRPDGGPFFAQNGLLFLSPQEVKATTQAMIAAQPFLGPLATDPSLRGVMNTLSTALMGVTRGQTSLDKLDKPIAAIADTLEKIAKGDNAFLSWQALITGGVDEMHTRDFLEVQPALNFTALSPGAAASKAIRDAVRALGLTPEQGVRVRLTGPVPLEDEEFATLADRAGLMAFVMFAAVTLTLWLAVRSVRIIACILATLLVGLSVTMGLGLAVAGVFNIISIAFVALFVGLGVDFGIQFTVRYRAERHRVHDLDTALIEAGRGVGIPLALAAAATAAGFFSFLPTHYVGVAELGMIAGMGMVIAFALCITMLPALIKLVRPLGEREEVGFAFLAPVDNFLVTHRRGVLAVAALAGLAALASVPFLRFDFNPLDLRSRAVESVSTLYDLMKDPQTSPNTIDVLAPSLSAADKLAARIARVPRAGNVLTLSSFLPDDQPTKLALIADASFLLDPTINPFNVKPPPSDADVVTSFQETAKSLREASTGADGKAAADANRLASVLVKLAGAPGLYRQRAATALIPGLDTMLDQMRASLQAAPVTLKSMPGDLVRDWIAPDATARIQVFPHDSVSDNKLLVSFSEAVLAVAPDATGAPISIQRSGETIIRAFVEAGLLSFVVIVLILAVVLRDLREVLMTLIPLVLTALLTLGTCVAIGLELNFANIIALPLLLGIGVAFDIYFVVSWRAGLRELLQSSLTRAVIFSALTTASGFGTLWLSKHPGTASMGELLMISLAWTLITTLFFLPALLGKPAPAARPIS